MNFTRKSTLFLLACTITVGAAQAQQAKKETPADALFREGRSLLQSGMVAEACAKFQESQNLEASAGTLLNLGDCYERAGRLVPAYEAFRDAEPLSKARARQDWVDTARTRSDALRAKVPTLVISLAGEERATVDAKNYDRDALAKGVMIEIGAHSVIVKSGDQTWAESFEATPGSKSVLTPKFKAAEKKSSTPPREAASSSSPLRNVGIVAMAVGGAAAATGLVFGALASSKKSDAAALCPNYDSQDVPQCTSPEARGLNDSAKSLALGSTILTFAGLGVGIGGLALFLLAPKQTLKVGPGPGLAGLTLTLQH
jgi:tetratricopeptide (TPR) repeat protein